MDVARGGGAASLAVGRALPPRAARAAFSCAKRLPPAPEPLAPAGEGARLPRPRPRPRPDPRPDGEARDELRPGGRPTGRRPGDRPCRSEPEPAEANFVCSGPESAVAYGSGSPVRPSARRHTASAEDSFVAATEPAPDAVFSSWAGRLTGTASRAPNAATPGATAAAAAPRGPVPNNAAALPTLTPVRVCSRTARPANLRRSKVAGEGALVPLGEAPAGVSLRGLLGELRFVPADDAAAMAREAVAAVSASK